MRRIKHFNELTPQELSTVEVAGLPIVDEPEPRQQQQSQSVGRAERSQGDQDQIGSRRAWDHDRGFGYEI